MRPIFPNGATMSMAWSNMSLVVVLNITTCLIGKPRLRASIWGLRGLRWEIMCVAPRDLVWLMLEEVIHKRISGGCGLYLPNFTRSSGNNSGQAEDLARELGGYTAHTSGTVYDQDCARFSSNLKLLKKIPCGEPDEGDGSCVLKAERFWFVGDYPVVREDIFRVRMTGHGGPKEPDF